MKYFYRLIDKKKTRKIRDNFITPINSVLQKKVEMHKNDIKTNEKMSYMNFIKMTHLIKFLM